MFHMYPCTKYLLISCLIVSAVGHANEEWVSDQMKPFTILNEVKISTFMYQIQNLTKRSKIDDLANTDYDMLVLEPGFNLTEDLYDVVYMVNRLKTKPNGEKRLLLAYIDIGQAEEWRTYWKSNWHAPTSTAIGSPSFIVSQDPDGWEGNYPVAYWVQEWKDIWLSDNGLIEQLARYGFDGVYLDWVEAYDDDKVRAVAAHAGVNPDNEMMDFIKLLGDVGKAIKPNFLVVSQNAPYLLDSNAAYYASLIDALVTEDTWFYGQGDAEWDSPIAGDLFGGSRHEGEYSTINRIAQNKKYLELGVPVFTVDYCISLDNARFVYKESRKNGFIPLVTRVSLSELTQTKPF